MRGQVASIARWSPHSTTCLTASDDRFSYQFLKTADRILAEAAVPKVQRWEEGFQILEKGLSYTLSMFVAHLPGEGFPLLERWALNPDAGIRRMLVENLEKKRLEAAHPEAIGRLLARLNG